MPQWIFARSPWCGDNAGSGFQFCFTRLEQTPRCTVICLRVSERYGTYVQDVTLGLRARGTPALSDEKVTHSFIKTDFMYAYACMIIKVMLVKIVIFPIFMCWSHYGEALGHVSASLTLLYYICFHSKTKLSWYSFFLTTHHFKFE